MSAQGRGSNHPLDGQTLWIPAANHETRHTELNGEAKLAPPGSFARAEEMVRVLDLVAGTTDRAVRICTWAAVKVCAALTKSCANRSAVRCPIAFACRDLCGECPARTLPTQTHTFDLARIVARFDDCDRTGDAAIRRRRQAAICGIAAPLECIADCTVGRRAGCRSGGLVA